MISMPAAYLDGFEGVRPLMYVVRIALSEVDALWLCSRSGVTVTYGGASVAPVTSYLPARMNGAPVEAIGEIDLQLNLIEGGNVGAVNEAKLLINNIEAAHAFFQGFDMENREIQIWEGFDPPGHTVAIETDMILRYSGVMQNVGPYDYLTFTIPCTDRRFTDMRTLPRTKVMSLTQGEYRTYSGPALRFTYAPKDSIDKVIPIVFGDFSQEPNVSEIEYVPLIPIDEYEPKYIASDHRMTLPASPRTYVKSGSTPLGVITSREARTNTDTGLEVDFYVATVAARYYLFPKGPATVYTTTPALNWKNAVDDDAYTNVPMVEGDELWVTFKEEEDFAKAIKAGDPEEIDTDIDCILKIFYHGGAGQPYIKMVRRGVGTASLFTIGRLSGDTAGVFEAPLNLEELGIPAMRDGVFSFDKLYEFEFGIIVGAGETVTVENIRMEVKGYPRGIVSAKNGNTRPGIRNFGSTRGAYRKWSDLNVGVGNEAILFEGCKGASYGYWIEGRGNGQVANTVIEQPAYAIEWLLREKLNVPEPAIDTASFDAVGNTTTGSRKLWKMAGILNQQKTSTEWLRQICFEFGLQLVITQAGKYRLVAMDDGDSVFTVTANELAYSKEEQKPSIEIDYTPVDKVFNDILLNYRVDALSGKPKQQKYVCDIDGNDELENNLKYDTGALRSTSYTNWLSESQTRYRVVKHYEILLELIRDEDTAELLLKKLADWWGYKRQIVRMALIKTTSTVLLEPGDIIKIDNSRVGNINANRAHYMITRINYPPVSIDMPATLTVECEEIPSETTGTTTITALAFE